MYVRRAPRPDNLEASEDPDDNFGFAIASLVLSLVSIFLFLFIIPLGAAGWILGIILGIAALRSRGKVMAIIGIVLSSLGLLTFIALLVLALRNGAAGI